MIWIYLQVLEIMDDNEMCGFPTHANIRIDFYDLVLKPKYFNPSFQTNRSSTDKNSSSKPDQDRGTVVSNNNLVRDPDEKGEPEDSYGSLTTQSAMDLGQYFADDKQIEPASGGTQHCMFSPRPSLKRTALSLLTDSPDGATRRSTCPSILLFIHDS